MTTITCAFCGKTKDVELPGAGFCAECGFICPDCTSTHIKKCPKCKQYKLKK